MALLRSPLKPLRRFFVVLWDAFAVFVLHTEIVLRSGIALLSSQLIPLYRFFVVLRDAFAFLVISPQTELCFCHALFGSFATPPGCFCVVLWYANALEIHTANNVLRGDMPLICKWHHLRKGRLVVATLIGHKAFVIPRIGNACDSKSDATKY